MATNEGRAVFPILPPGTQRIPVETVVARFEGDGRPRLLGQIEAPGTPGSSMEAHWVVIDSTQREVARSSRPLSPSACEPTQLRVADFASDLPPGRYTAALSVRDGAAGRGVHRTTIDVPDTPAGVRLSDVLVACGAPPPGAMAIRPEPNPGARVVGDDPLTAYFEVYGLEPGDEGRARFEYYYTVRSAEQDDRIWIKRLFQPRPGFPPIAASRTEEHVGEVRRQYVTVPVRSLPPGRFELEIRVRDLVGGGLAVRSALFERL
jgi:hypothetical protein